MKKIITAGLVMGVCSGLATAGVDVSLDFASAYVFRGTTYNDGFVFQPGIKASGLGLPEEYGAITVGAWANYDIDDYGGSINSSETSEVDWYFSYSLPTFVEGLDLFVGYCDYTYPNAEGESDKEANVGVGYELAGVSLGATYYYGMGGGVKGSSYYELSASYGYDITEALNVGVGARVGFADQDGGESGFNDYDLSGSLTYALSDIWSVGASLAYIGQGDDDLLPDGKGSYDVDVVGMLSFGASF